MGLYDDIDNEVLNNKANTNNANNISTGGLFDDIDNEVLNAQPQPSFVDNAKELGGKVVTKAKNIQKKSVSMT